MSPPGGRVVGRTANVRATIVRGGGAGRGQVRTRVVVAASVLTGLVGGGFAHAACNIIPGATRTFRGTLATLDRPFARPGDVVELGLDRKSTRLNSSH